MQLILPKYVTEVLREIQDETLESHLGVNMTLGKLRERFYSVNSQEDVKN